MRPRLAVHKFASCDGCQLALLNAGEELLELSRLFDIVHFAEAGPLAPDATVDIAVIEGSISTPHDADRIVSIRSHSSFVMTIGACATSGGLQALRNGADVGSWSAAIYARPEYIRTLSHSTPIRDHIPVDFELWGCPVSSQQVLQALRDILSGIQPRDETRKVCQECKRREYSCVLVSHGLPCLGPVTRAGCGALCPGLGRECYGCYGPAENSNVDALAEQFRSLGLSQEDIARRFRFIHSGLEIFSSRFKTDCT